MKKKEKELTKKAKKQIRRSLEETLIEEIKKAITGQGRSPKKVTKEIKKAASQIARKLADKASISKPVEAEEVAEAADIKERANSFDVPPILLPALPVVADPPVEEAPAADSPIAKVRRTRRIAGEIAAQAEATPAKPVRKRVPRVNATAKEEPVEPPAESAPENEDQGKALSPDENRSE